jgi:UDP-N-acetylglucosamine--N-acetylmuramyl-(pentapeptide) pyrophosphoryl-undecaprenol N-acetylglucosamine transferase
MVPVALARLSGANIEVWHQTGEADLAQTREAYAGQSRATRVDAFINDMPAAYDWADVVVCRSGAMTVAELAAAGLPALLVPFPHAVDDHQTANGRYLADAGAAVMLADATLTPETLSTVFAGWLADRAGLLRMGQRARELALPAAATTVAGHCMELLDA